MSDFITDRHSTECKQYRLFASSIHSGSLSGGHYYSYCRNLNGDWNQFNDSSVYSLEGRNIVVSGAYTLFYERID